MDIPSSMAAELQAWNGGEGIDLAAWIGCEGRFSLAVGYLTVFWPDFDLLDDHIVRARTTLDSLRGFQLRQGSTRQSVETVLNHLHLTDIQHLGCPDASADKLLALGTKLKEIYEAKLAWQFPDRPCIVSLLIPEDQSDLNAYQLTFWQATSET
ncbi:hypothetical protein [Luteibacter aegosomatissinici]|uniref:hypothetical protein n=1 Tax=Luteibacter aegosomatissinici TaxID=2911539 RepID=UPI001FF91399|nr:hypothetical protein [Luteibacter aegosomatissinici]UPG96078.1 hypothetical protein L2Y97_08200 [Luteibacter aegosomatissinici]